jgi:hypothetical protein
MNNWCICWLSGIFLLGNVVFKGLTTRRLYKSFGFKGLMFLISNLFMSAIEELFRIVLQAKAIGWNITILIHYKLQPTFNAAQLSPVINQHSDHKNWLISIIHVIMEHFMFYHFGTRLCWQIHEAEIPV